MTAVPRTAPLHVRLASLIQLVRTNCANDGCSMPTLPPFEASLLLAAESCKDVLVAREWRACELALAKEGVVPMAADRSRIAATVHSGGSRIDGVWSAQHEMLAEELSRDMNVRPCLHVGVWACGRMGVWACGEMLTEDLSRDMNVRHHWPLTVRHYSPTTVRHHSPSHPLTTHPITLSPLTTRPLTHSPTHPLAHSPTHPLPTHPLTHYPLTHYPLTTHPLTHYPLTTHLRPARIAGGDDGVP